MKSRMRLGLVSMRQQLARENDGAIAVSASSNGKKGVGLT